MEILISKVEGLKELLNQIKSENSKVKNIELKEDNFLAIENIEMYVVELEENVNNNIR
jgi:hypothetical protein